MDALYPKLILDALAQVRYPGNGKSLVENEMIEDDIRIDGRKVSFSIIFEKENDPFIRSVVKAAEAAILTFVAPDVEIQGNIGVKFRVAARPTRENPLPNVKNIIAISSGKGGVGKSTVTANFALALAAAQEMQVPAVFAKKNKSKKTVDVATILLTALMDLAVGLVLLLIDRLT